MATDCPTRVPLLAKFTRGEKLSMGIIRNQGFGISTLKIVAFQRTWDIEWEERGK